MPNQLPPHASYPGFVPTAQTPVTPTMPMMPTAPNMPGMPMQPGQTQPYYGPPDPNQQYPGYPGQQYPGYAGQYPGYGAPPVDEAAVAAKKRQRKRILWGSTAAVAVVAVVAVGVVVLTSGRSGNSAVTKVACDPTDLTSCLIKSPAGAVQISPGTEDAAYLEQTTTTASAYSANITNDSVGMKDDTSTMLTADGSQKIVHTDWNAVDGDDVDLILLGFGTQKGAQAWSSTRGAEILAGYPGQAVAIPGDPAGKAHAGTKADSAGLFDAAYSTVVGTVVLDVAYSSPNQFSAQDLQTWAGTELASLRSAPAAAADPVDAGAGTQDVACAAMSSCLMPMPPGGARWNDPNSKDWVKAASLTNQQYVQLGWQASAQADVLSDFNADGVTAIGHDDWATGNADKQADIYVVQALTATGANTLALKYFHEPSFDAGITGVGYVIPNESGSQAWYSNKKDSEGLTEFNFNEVVGNVIVTGWMFFAGSFDTSTADSWAQTELNLVNVSSGTQPLGAFSLTAPTLPAAAQGTCPSADDCLLPLPGSATDTTGSSYNPDQGVEASKYAIQDEATIADEFTAWLGSDGFVSGEHRSWTAGGGATADDVVLKYTDPAQAQAAALLEYGANAESDHVCTGSALPDSFCLALPVSTTDPLIDETVWVLAWKGDYEVSIQATKSNGADLTDAYTWAQQQLDQLPAS